MLQRWLSIYRLEFINENLFSRNVYISYATEQSCAIVVAQTVGIALRFFCCCCHQWCRKSEQEYYFVLFARLLVLSLNYRICQ